MKSSREIRNIFLSFFREKGHQIVPSAPIVVKNDPTLLFTNAGMNQFKDIFLGIKNPSAKRCADTQKCLRASGKQNDLEEVGHDTYHHTMFEMLGNWSFGDYYKREAIAWAWELLTEVYEIPKDRLYVTVFGGDESDGLGVDKEAEIEWEQWISKERILYGSKKDNFWEMGDTGPSGPCSEIHIDLRSEEERKKISGKELVNEDHPEVIEIWNLVFIQFNRKADGSLEQLPEKHIDTGMGFERLVMVLQGKKATYDTDLFEPSIQYLTSLTGIQYERAKEEERIAFRVIIDHIRAIVFAISDGQLPSNTGAGYVIRRILRRASRYAFSFLALKEPFLYKMVDILSIQYRDVFDEVGAQASFIQRIIEEEEKGFLKKLESGTEMFENHIINNSNNKKLDGKFAFQLYDTFGFPIDLTQLMAAEKGREVDMAAFEVELEKQKERSRKATEILAGDWSFVSFSTDLPRFVGYDTLEIQTEITQYRTVTAKKKKLYHLVLAETPFYAESGGQIGDIGVITNGIERLKVLDTKRENELIIHLVDKLPENPEGSWSAVVDRDFRKQVSLNHSATHLLHAALRELLGNHIEQRGSYVGAKSLRFDFSHFSKVSDEELVDIENKVNNSIGLAIPLKEYRDMPIEQAKEMGAMALFGEKYGDLVRVVVFDHDYSVELCGGTHVANTSQIRLFKLISEGSVASGIRRVEALTGIHAIYYVNEKIGALDRIAALLKGPGNLEKAIEELATKNKELEKSLQELNAEKVNQLKIDLIKKAIVHNEIRLISEVVELSSADDLKQLSFELKKITENTLVVLGTEVGGKALLSVIMSDDLAAKNIIHAGNLVKSLAKLIKGGGGGQAFYATAGGKDVSKLPEVIDRVTEFLDE